MLGRKTSLLARIFVIAGIAALVVVLNIWSALAAPALSNSGGGSWQYYRDISVTENSGSALSGYQVLVQLSSSTFPTSARSDGADVRFAYANGNELSYWIESWDYSGKNAKIWIKIPSIQANAIATIRIYYGNPDASPISNGNIVFDFFDDFEYSDSVTNHGWGNTDTRIGLPTTSTDWATSGTRSIKLVHTRDRLAGIIRQIPIPTPFLITYDAKQTQTSTASIFVGSATTNDWIVSGTSNEVLTLPYAFTIFTIYSYTNPVTYTDSYNYPAIFMGQSTSYSSATAYVDNFRVRKYASLEPTLTLGAEQKISSQAQNTPTQTPNTTTSIYQTVISTPILSPTSSPQSYELPQQPSNFYLYAGIGFIAILLVSILVFKGRSSSQEKEHPNPVYGDKEVKNVSHRVEATPQVKPISIVSRIDIKTAFHYKGATIIFKIKLENNTLDPISDIKVYPYVPNVFLLKEEEKSIALIEPNSSQTVTFEIRPTGECGDCNVSGRINYYDMESRKRKDIELEPKSLSIVCPMLHGKEISDADWHEAVSHLVKTEESTKEIDMPAESLFTMVSRIIRDMHMYMQKPEVTQNHHLFNGVARFYGEGLKGLRYAAQVEVVGGAKKSKLILKAWAEKEDALTGFYHGILDEIEKRINVKGYIEDSIVQYNVHIGDKIGTQVKDSFVQHSTIGAYAKKCPNCGREVEANEKFCLECGVKL